MFKIYIIIIIFSVGFCSLCGVVYQEKDNALWITDYPESDPCTPMKLYELDQKNGWKKVEYDKATDTFKIDASLWIGNNQNTNTYFQVGDDQHPEIALIVKGNVFVKPYWERGKNPGKNWWSRKGKRYINRLTLGNQSNDKIKPVLKIDNSVRKGYSLIIGGGKINNIHGGQLHAYNATITAASMDKKSAIGVIAGKSAGRIFLGGYQGNILQNVVLSHAAGMMSYAIYNRFKDSMNNVTFSDGGIALSSSMTSISDCVIKNCRVGIYDMGNLNLTMRNCKLENNQTNWDLRNGGKGITFIDCEIGEPKNRNVLLKRQKAGRTIYPQVILKRHIIIKVTDKDGKPVPKAQIKITPDITDSDLEELIFTTDKQGMTSGKGSSNAIMLVEEKLQASETLTPVNRKFSYTITAEVPWLSPSQIKNFKPTKSWETITISLK